MAESCCRIKTLRLTLGMRFSFKSSLLSLAAALVALCFCRSAKADLVVDQLNAGTEGSVSFTGDYLWQSFQPSADNISGAGFIMYSNAGGGSRQFFVGIFSDNPSTAPGSLLASGSVSATTGNWADVFWNSTALTPGGTYYLGLLSTNPQDSAFSLSFTVGNAYAPGKMGFGTFPVNADYDLTFRTYASVPDVMSTAAILGVTLTGLALIRRRSKGGFNREGR
ncbi:MAG: sorting protein [Verrucomicrobia bacterium]|nr:sorting protein [Verrucomicrobiota bacterium]